MSHLLELAMKSRISITLSENVVRQMDLFLKGNGNRSAFIEKAIKRYLIETSRFDRDATDIHVLDEHADQLNAEAIDVLTFQTPVI